MINWAQTIAADLASTFDGVAIYSNVDPAREFTGEKTIEINVNSESRVALLSGGAFVDYILVAACRAVTYDDAASMAATLRGEIKSIIAGYIETKDIIDGFITSCDVSPDIRGINEGASFYGVVNFTLTTREI